MIWLLINPTRVDTYRADGSLTYTQATGLAVMGDADELETVPNPTADEIAEASPYVWLGGYLNTTTDPAIKDLWLREGYAVAGPETLYPSPDLYPGPDVYPSYALEF